MLERLYRRLFPSAPIAPLVTLKKEGAEVRGRADELVQRLDREHEQHVREQHRMDPAKAIRRARALREQP